MLAKKIAMAAIAITLFTSCNNEEKTTDNNSPATTTEGTEKKIDNSAEIQELNDQSKALIRLMNSKEEEKNAAIAAGDEAAAAACRKTIDSAAKENVRIGQRLMELQ